MVDLHLLNRNYFLDEDNCAECDEVLIGLEKIDDETDALDITFVKVMTRQMLWISHLSR
jgi:hypothetical protein